MQVAWGAAEEPRVALVDCVAADPRPLVDLVADPDCVTIGHAVKQDLGLLAARFQISARGLVDTQIAAAFLGMGDQIGYGKMIKALLGLRLEKDAQYTEWLRRPLSPRQLRYAANDVRYLPAAWRALDDRLGERGRRSWVVEESAALADSIVLEPDDATSFRDVRGWRRLDPEGLGGLRTLAAWRQRTARRRNRPLSWVLPDRALIDLCRLRPNTPHALTKVRGIGDGTVRRYGEEIVEQLALGLADPLTVPRPAKPPPLDARGQVWAATVAHLIQARCEAAEIAPRFVATRAESDALVAWFAHGEHSHEPDLPLLRGWRRELCGDPALAWLRGEAAIAVGEAGAAALRLVVCGRDSE